MQNSRKLITAVVLLGATLAALPIAVHPQQANDQRSLSLVGEIMDSRCAIDGFLNKIMQENRTKTAKDCTLQCAKSGGSYVLFDPETKSVYQLDDQQKPERFAGQRVRVSGTYDEPSNTMHVESIEAAK